MRCTTTRPGLQAGVELYGIAGDLMHVGDLNGAAAWLAAFSNWCTAWEGFLKERTVVDGRSQYKHERLRKARRILKKLCREGTLFAYLDENLVKGGDAPSTSNKIESNNARIRALFEGPSRDERRTQDQGGILVVLYAFRGSAFLCECPASDAG